MRVVAVVRSCAGGSGAGPTCDRDAARPFARGGAGMPAAASMSSIESPSRRCVRPTSSSSSRSPAPAAFGWCRRCGGVFGPFQAA
jgi:hypothetical protein